MYCFICRHYTSHRVGLTVIELTNVIIMSREERLLYTLVDTFHRTQQMFKTSRDFEILFKIT